MSHDAASKSLPVDVNNVTGGSDLVTPMWRDCDLAKYHWRWRLRWL